MTAHVTGSHIGFMLAVVGYLFTMRAMAASAEDLEQVLRQAVRNAMFVSELSVKDAAFRLGRDEANLRKALRGDANYYLPLIEMVLHWPLLFWVAFTPTLFSVLAQKRMAEIAETAHELVGR